MTEATVGSEELLAALRSEGEKRAMAIRAEAEAEAARRRGEAAAALNRLGEEFAQKKTRAVAAAENYILAEAERAAAHIRLAATEKLAARLYVLASRLLPRLRNDNYPETFRRLAGELPLAAWETVRVNPADTDLAGSLFPEAEVVPDAAICGGMDAEAERGKIRIINTLEKRLERGWQELLPPLLEEIENHA